MSGTRMRPLVAARALRQLLQDPERTDLVFVIIRALSGRSLVRGHRRFARTEAGQRILRQRRALLASLQDRAALRQLPPGSLGRAYLRFVEAEKITADGLVEASAREAQIEDPGVRLYAERTRDQHDLWHTLTEYGRNPFGEACLLAFTYAQTGNLALAVIALLGTLKLARAMGLGAASAIWQGYKAGRRAAWLPQQNWEALLHLPLPQVRRDLRIAPPQKYHQVFRAFVAAAH